MREARRGEALRVLSPRQMAQRRVRQVYAQSSKDEKDEAKLTKRSVQRTIAGVPRLGPARAYLRSFARAFPRNRCLRALS